MKTCFLNEILFLKSVSTILYKLIADIFCILQDSVFVAQWTFCNSGPKIVFIKSLKCHSMPDINWFLYKKKKKQV